jgi:hypothetical protein
MDIDGMTLAVGGARDVSIFERRGERWQLVERLAPSQDAEAAFGYGRSVAVVGSTLTVGHPFQADRGVESGAVYVYERAADGWGLRDVLHAGNQGAWHNFGAAVAADGDVLVVGAPNHYQFGNM